MTQTYLHNTSDTVDTGQWGARKKAPSSKEEKQRLFTNYKNRVKNADLSFLDKK